MVIMADSEGQSSPRSTDANQHHNGGLRDAKMKDWY